MHMPLNDLINKIPSQSYIYIFAFICNFLMTTQVVQRMSPDDLKFIELASPATNIQSVTHKNANTQHYHNVVNTD